ncbi:sensor histidine kinase [Stackebrandtia soli]|uniref:sensor histidine kinase n=1 Tax=Stackebrandtia soli TaxID=1892856 RepID=UPI0039EB56E8
MTTIGRLDRWERHLDLQIRLTPYVLLVVSFGLYWLTEDETWDHRLTTLGITTAAAAWVSAEGRVKWKSVYIAGLVVLIAALSARGVWFAGFFGFIGYLHSWRYLNGPWRFVGVVATAAVSVPAYTGGLPDTIPGILTYLLFTAAITALVTMFSFFGDVTNERSSERKRTVERLEEALRENAGLHAQLLVQAREAGVLDERQRIAAEIHDTLAQSLAGIVAQIQAANGADDWRPHTDKALRLARAGLAEARRTVRAVGPAQLDAAPLTGALGEIVERWTEGNPGRAGFTATGTVRDLHPEIEAALLRIAQEALKNVAKHAGAARTELTLSYMEDVVVLDVCDDGIGFDLENAPDTGGFGLVSMRKRAERLSGSLTVESHPNDGTAVSATLPAIAREDPHA